MIFAIAFIYLFIGAMWVINDFSQTSSNRSMYVRNNNLGLALLFVLIWPIRALDAASRNAEMRKRQRMRQEKEENSR